MKIYILLPILVFSLSGCLMIGKEKFACQNGEDLKDAGICGSSMYILKNKKTIENDSYRNFKKDSGTYKKCTSEKDCEKTKLNVKDKELW